jgi:hypothetical protein
MKKSSINSKFLTLLIILIVLGCSDNESESDIVIKMVSHTTGTSGRLIVIGGNGFASGIDGNKVTINDQEAQIVLVEKAPTDSAYQTQISVIVPTSAGNGPIKLLTRGQTIVGPVFTYIIPPEITYFIEFKVDGILKRFEGLDNSFNHCSSCVCMNLEDNIEWSGLKICFPSLVTPNMIESLKGRELKLRDNAPLPNASFVYATKNEFYYSDVLDNLNSRLTVSTVEYHSSSLLSSNAYTVIGTFEGVIQSANSTSTILVTEGNYKVRFVSVIF